MVKPALIGHPTSKNLEPLRRGEIRFEWKDRQQHESPLRVFDICCPGTRGMPLVRLTVSPTRLGGWAKMATVVLRRITNPNVLSIHIIPIIQAKNEARLKDLEGRAGTGAGRRDRPLAGAGGELSATLFLLSGYPLFFWHRKCVRVPDGVVHGFGDRGPELGRAARQQGRWEIITKFTRCRSDWMVRENERFRTSPLEPPQNLNAGQL